MTSPKALLAVSGAALVRPSLVSAAVSTVTVVLAVAVLAVAAMITVLAVFVLRGGHVQGGVTRKPNGGLSFYCQRKTPTRRRRTGQGKRS